MRRSAAWLPLLALVAATGVGTGFGLAGQPGAAADGGLFLQQVLATTQAGGSAHFTFSSVTTSPNRLLRSSARGTGAVSFSARTGEATTISHSTGESRSGSGPLVVTPTTTVLHQVQQGRTLYFEIGNPGLPGMSWAAERHLPRSFPGVFYLGGLNDLISAAEPGPSFALTVSTVGSRVVAGTATTEYSVAASSNCPVPRAQAGLGRVTLGPTFVWVDGRGRLTRLQTTTAQVIPPVGHGYPAALSGRATTVDTLQLRGYGVPVTIHPPSPLALARTNGTGLVFASPQACP